MATKLLYFDHMWTLHSTATVVSVITEGERVAVVLDQTILYPQGGGQPCDTGHIEATSSSDSTTIRFSVKDVRAKSGVVHHYGNYETEAASFKPGDGVKIAVDNTRRTLNSRLHSAGHLLDACMSNTGLGSFEPGKGHHFPDSPFVEYKGVIPSKDVESKRAALESEINRLVTLGGQVFILLLSTTWLLFFYFQVFIFSFKICFVVLSMRCWNVCRCKRWLHLIQKLQLCVVEVCLTTLPRIAAHELFAWVTIQGALVEELMFLTSLKLGRSRSLKFV